MDHERIRVPIDLRLLPEEAVKLDEFLKITGRKRVPWVLQLILRELDAFEASKVIPDKELPR